MKNRNTRRGFTLIELLIVVLIVAILAAIAVPQYQKAVKKVQGKEVLLAINTLDKAVSAYALEHGNLISTLGNNKLNPNISVTAEDLDIKIPSLKHFWYYSSYTGMRKDFYSASRYGLHIETNNAQVEIKWDGTTGKRIYARCDGAQCHNYFDCRYEEETGCHIPVSPCPASAIYTKNFCYLN